MSAIQRIKPITIARYALLPGIVPRIREFAQNGFGWLAYLMAYVYVCVRLLPPGHPYLLPANFGRYGIRHVIAEAANRLELRRDNIDQIVIFLVLLLGFILLIGQFAMLAAGFIIHPAMAGAPAGFLNFFQTQYPRTDIAYELLDRVFAVPNLYGSQYDPAAGGIPAFNQGLQKLIEFYNYAILIVGVAVFLYYMVVIVAETALTGSPFGRRFDHVYAPFRLVVAVGLLIPLNYGFNGAQYITLFAAKYGSSLATNTWLLFNQSAASGGGVTANPIGAAPQTLLARPQLPDVADVVEFVSLARTCKVGYELEYQNPPYATVNAATVATNIQPYLVGTEAAGTGAMLTNTGWNAAIGPTMFNNRDITIRFGQRDVDLYPQLKGNVYPFCGEMTIHTGDVTQYGARVMQAFYYGMVRRLWNDPELDQFAHRAAAIYLTAAKTAAGNPINPATIAVGGDNSATLPDENWRQAKINEYAEPLQTAVEEARDGMAGAAAGAGAAGADFNIEADLLHRGWGGAAIWYNRIAMWNGALFGVVFSTPSASAMPSALTKTETERRLHDENVGNDNRYEPYMQDGRPVGILEGEVDLVREMSAVVKYWTQDHPGSTTGGIDSHRTGNFIIDIINKLFPLDSLMQIRYNIDVNPLAQLVGLGKSIIDSTVRNLTFGLAFAAGGGLMDAMQSGMGAPMNFASTLAIGLSTLSLTVGFVLYYALPFMPFIYFFFAVGSWIKTIFEAMVGVPLWALAHLRIDGAGLPGERALDGYFLIFEIFVRPVLILFGLLGGLVLFSAMARALHDVFTLVVVNVTGYDGAAAAAGAAPPGGGPDLLAYQGNALDEFFYTIVYTIILYSLGLSSFKMIDQIPSSIMRWMGAGIRSFAEDGDAAQGMLGYLAVGGQRVTGQMISGAAEGARGAGSLVGGGLRALGGRARTVTGTGPGAAGGSAQAGSGSSGGALATRGGGTGTGLTVRE